MLGLLFASACGTDTLPDKECPPIDTCGTYYEEDEDGDGYGNDASAQCTSCSTNGLLTVGGDCDDNNADVNPGASEEPGNGIDEDCDGRDVVFDATASWNDQGVSLTITGGGASTTYDFGMAQTGVGDAGWYEEDCVVGTLNGAPDLGYDYCHPTSESGVVLRSVDTVEEIVEGETTTFRRVDERDLTYVLFKGSSLNCWTWGHDPTYYEVFDCAEI